MNRPAHVKRRQATVAGGSGKSNLLSWCRYKGYCNQLTWSCGQQLTSGKSVTRVLVNLFYGLYGSKPSVLLWSLYFKPSSSKSESVKMISLLRAKYDALLKGESQAAPSLWQGGSHCSNGSQHDDGLFCKSCHCFSVNPCQWSF